MTTQVQQRPLAELQQGRGMAAWVAMYQAYNAIFKRAELAILSHGLSLPQLLVLAALRSAGEPMTIGHLAHAIVKETQTLTGLVDRLEDSGLVERAFDRSDRRKVWVRLTEAGRQRFDEALPVFRGSVETALNGLSDEELGQVEASLQKVAS